MKFFGKVASHRFLIIDSLLLRWLDSYVNISEIARYLE